MEYINSGKVKKSVAYRKPYGSIFLQACDNSKAFTRHPARLIIIVTFVAPKYQYAIS